MYGIDTDFFWFPINKSVYIFWQLVSIEFLVSQKKNKWSEYEFSMDYTVCSSSSYNSTMCCAAHGTRRKCVMFFFGYLNRPGNVPSSSTGSAVRCWDSKMRPQMNVVSVINSEVKTYSYTVVHQRHEMMNVVLGNMLFVATLIVVKKDTTSYQESNYKRIVKINARRC